MQALPPWVFVIVGLSTMAFTGIAFVQLVLGRPVGNNPASNGMLIVMLVVFCIALPALFLLMKLQVETTPEGVHVRFRPFLNRLIRYEEIESAVAQTYSPLKEYGGWGIRGWGKRVAYNARGNEGVLLTLKNGGTIMLGTQKPSDLESAIRAGLR